MMDEQTMVALRERVHARPDVRQALAAEQDAAIYGHRLSPGQRAAVVRQAYREEWSPPRRLPADHEHPTAGMDPDTGWEER